MPRPLPTTLVVDQLREHKWAAAVTVAIAGVLLIKGSVYGLITHEDPVIPWSSCRCVIRQEKDMATAYLLERY